VGVAEKLKFVSA